MVVHPTHSCTRSIITHRLRSRLRDPRPLQVDLLVQGHHHLAVDLRLGAVRASLHNPPVLDRSCPSNRSVLGKLCHIMGILISVALQIPAIPRVCAPQALVDMDPVLVSLRRVDLRVGLLDLLWDTPRLSLTPPPRAPSDPSFQGGVRMSPSSRSLASQYEQHSQGPAPPIPNYPGEYPPPRPGFTQRNGSSSSLPTMSSAAIAQPSRPILPSAQLSMKSFPPADSFQDPSPPGSPVLETKPPVGPTSSRITAQTKCKVFLKQQHEQWKSLGGAKLKLYHESPTNVKQLVVEADNKDKSVLISTIILADGVERVGKTGVAVELSDRGQRTGIIYMLQLKNEASSRNLFDSLLAGSDRFAVTGKA